MEEIEFDKIADVSPQDKLYLEKIIAKSKIDGVQMGITWSEDVYSYLFETNLAPVDISGMLGIDIFAEEL